MGCITSTGLRSPKSAFCTSVARLSTIDHFDIETGVGEKERIKICSIYVNGKTGY